MESAESIRALVVTSRPQFASAGFPAEVRERVKTYVQDGWRRGLQTEVIAREIGLSRTTVREWVGTPTGPVTPFLRVELAADAVAVAAAAPLGHPPAPAATTCVLLSPKGFRVEGLTVDAIAALLERLG